MVVAASLPSEFHSHDSTAQFYRISIKSYLIGRPARLPGYSEGFCCCCCCCASVIYLLAFACCSGVQELYYVILLIWFVLGSVVAVGCAYSWLPPLVLQRIITQSTLQYRSPMNAKGDGTGIGGGLKTIEIHFRLECGLRFAHTAAC